MGVGSEPTESTGGGYRAHLDGLRAVAVYLVVLFHAGADRFGGGFIGVDVFFVLSGYLVTQLLLRDLDANGSIGLRRFYSRRMRRLLPASSVVLLVTMVVYSSIGSPAELPDAEQGIRAAALYVSNWFFIGQSADYFGADIQANPVIHFWSLSVEEQFYFAWPLLLGGLAVLARRAGPRGRHLVRGTVAVAMVASLAEALWIAQSNLTRAYYGTDTRAYQLLAGALIALSPQAMARLRARPARPLGLVAVVALAALVLLGTDLSSLGPVSRGVAAALLTVALLVALDTAPGPARSLLSLPPIVYLGRISYGTYLWHWLVIIVTTRLVGASPLTTALIAIVVGTALAALSFELLERPVREARSLDHQRLAVVVAGLTTSVLIGVVIAPRVLDDDAGGVVAVDQGTATGATPVPADLDWQGAQNDLAEFPPCTADDVDACTSVTGAGAHVLLIGDSHARMYIPMLTGLAEDNDLTLSTAVAPVCPWQEDLLYFRRVDECRAQQDEWYPAIVDGLDPDVVIVAHRPIDDPTNTVRMLDGDAGEIDLYSATGVASVEARTADTLDELRADGRQVVILEPVPIAPKGEDPIVCLSEAAFLDECRFVTDDEPTPVEQVFRRLAEADEGVWSLDLDRQVCPYLPICDPIVGGRIVRRDDTHLTTEFARTLQAPLEELLVANGLLEQGGGRAVAGRS
jgi:peptidoglycan/LPS O-acetylase OafA/YrhL